MSSAPRIENRHCSRPDPRFHGVEEPLHGREGVDVLQTGMFREEPVERGLVEPREREIGGDERGSSRGAGLTHELAQAPDEGLGQRSSIVSRRWRASL